MDDRPPDLFIDSGPVNVFTHGKGSDIAGLKYSHYDITPQSSNIEIGGCRLNILARSVAEPVKVKITLGIDFTKAPGGYIRASATLTCEPPIKFKKPVHVQLPTWFTTKKGVDLDLFRRTNSKWEKIESVALTDERLVDVHMKDLDNVTAFLSKKCLDDVKVAVKSYLCHNSNGTFGSTFTLSDQIMDSLYMNEIKQKKFVSSLQGIKEMELAFGDVIHYRLSTEDKAKKSSKVQEVKGEVMIDEGFVEEVKGHVTYNDLGATPFTSTYNIRQMREMGGRNEVIVETDYPVILQVAQAPQSSCSIKFLGEVTADNVFSNVGDVEIDQRTMIDEATGQRRKQRTDNISYEEKKVPKMKAEPIPAMPPMPSMTLNSGSRGRQSQITFHGKVTVKNMIGNADNVRIDQRRIVTRSRPDDDNKTPPTEPRQAEGDIPFPTQVDDPPPGPDDAGSDPKSRAQPMDEEPSSCTPASKTQRAFVPPKGTGKGSVSPEGDDAMGDHE